MTAAGALVVTVSAAYLLLGFFEDRLLVAMGRKAEAESALIAGDLESAMASGRRGDAEKILRTALRDREVVYAFAAKEDGSAFASMGEMPAELLRSAKGGRRRTEVLERSGLIQVVTPVTAGRRRLGAVFMGFSLSDIGVESAKARTAVVASSIAISLAFTLSMFFTMRRIVARPISRITREVALIGDGDLRRRSLSHRGRLTAEIEAMYSAIDRTAEAFRGNVVAISDSSRQFAAMADEILGSTAGLSGAASQQAGAINEISVTLEEMEKTGRLSAHSAGEIAAAADESVKVSAEGLAAVDDSVSQLRDIRAQVDEILESVRRLDLRLDEVDKIISSVSDVTRQSHTLSINASIEAAKAGSAGRGFAVVANKVRDLAHQSRLATDDVRTTLANIQVAMRAVVESSEFGRQRAERGVESIERTGRVIRRLSEVIQTTADAARGIAVNANEQVVGLGETLHAMVDIKQAAQLHLSGAREVEAQGERLSSKAAEMEEIVARFKTED